jgi:RNA-directed DNA polymerase
MIRAWLTAGVMERGRFAPTEEGAPQGGVISPLILNITLHGMETAAGVRYFRRSRGGIETAPEAPVLVRYADDLLVFCRSRQHAEQVKQQLAEWLRPRGLGFNEAKTQIVHLNQGCDFLGFNIRRYHGKLPLIKPSDNAVRRIRERKAAHRDACSAWQQCRLGAGHTHPDHSGLGCLLPDRGLQRGVLRAG